MEGFWGTIKAEMYYLKNYDSQEELKRGIITYIEFFNTKRIRLPIKI